MALIVNVSEAMALRSEALRQQAYNGLDVTGTAEVSRVLRSRLDEQLNRTYSFERAIQAPALQMMVRGCAVDLGARAEALKVATREWQKATRLIDKMPQVRDFWDGMEKVTGYCPKEPDKHHKWQKGVPDGPERLCERCGSPRMVRAPFNANSQAQVERLLYVLHGLPAERNKDKKVSVDDDCLEKVGRKHKEFFPLCEAIRDVRDQKKQIGWLNGRLNARNRYPSSFNVGAAWTGRFSSSKNPHGEGGNLQNVAPKLRHVIVADPGYDLWYIDFKTGESYVVAYESGDPVYIEAHATGDTHTFVARLLWPHFPWTGDLKKDKDWAKSHNPEWDKAEGHDWRFQAKRIQHGSNFGLTPPGIAMIAHIPMAEAVKAQRNYFGEFEYIKPWQNSIIADVRESKPLVNALGRKIRLFGRPWDPHTHKQGLAFKPQSTVADLIDIALWRVWYYMEPKGVQLLAQVHDALLLQIPRGRFDLAAETIEMMRIPININGRTLIIDVEASYGRNWGKFDPEKNPFGQKDFKP